MVMALIALRLRVRHADHAGDPGAGGWGELTANESGPLQALSAPDAA